VLSVCVCVRRRVELSVESVTSRSRCCPSVCACVDEWSCLWNQFSCTDKCIDRMLVCDGVRHCTDGEDERDCGKPGASAVSVYTSKDQ